jgi:hypothetical protein
MTPTEESFLKDVAGHKMTILKDDGVHRHIVFKKPGTNVYRFELVTWNGCLCYTGDMGTFVFQRLEDMFQFFRMNDNDWNHNKNGLSINLGYWSEKLIAVDGGRDGGAAKEFSKQKFTSAVKEHLVSWMKEHRDTTSKEERRELWEEVEVSVLSSADDGQHQCGQAAYDYSWRGKQARFEFVDIFDRTLTEYTYHFVWCCYAIAWAITLYDKKQGGTT